MRVSIKLKMDFLLCGTFIKRKCGNRGNISQGKQENQVKEE